MYQLRIIFSCLCAYLPRKNDVLVVLPDGRKGHGSYTVHNHHPGHNDSGAIDIVPPHIPVIEFDPVELSPQSDLKPDLLFSRPGARRDRGVLFLTGHDISLDPAQSGAPALRKGRTAGTEVPSSAAEAEDFTWIADIKKLDAAAGIIDPACVMPGTSAGERVAARMSLQGGTLAAQLLGRDAGGMPILFHFIDANSPASTRTDCSQALAGGVVYDLPISSKEVALVLTPFKHSARRLVFSFCGLPIGSTIEVMIKNMPLDSVLEITNKIYPGREVEVDPHFAMYYALSATPPTTPWIPYGTKARFSGPICPGARFSETL